MFDKVKTVIAERWIEGVVLAWLVIAALLLAQRIGMVEHFFLTDTDDNLRMAQVRAWLDGQAWYDLRQYRLAPPGGYDIHWSRLVDLPIAGLILLLTPVLGSGEAERWAAALAPFIPLCLTLFALALVARRVIAPAAWPLVMFGLMFSSIAIGMFFPLRIDHHGWQIAMVSWVMAGLVDPQRRRGGVIAGLATALSLVIGLEMLVFLALLGCGVVLGWVARPEERERLAGYAVSLGGAGALGFVIFASEANQSLRCDAFTPVWLADILIAGALALLLAWRNPVRWQTRLAFAALAGGVLAAFHALAFPACLSRLEGVPPDVAALWLDRVNEARSILTHSPSLQLRTFSVILAGLIGYGLLIASARSDVERMRKALLLSVPALFSTALLFWQLRAAPAAQLFAIPGAAALIWLAMPKFWNSGNVIVRTLGVSALFSVGIGALPQVIGQYMPKNAVEKARATTPPTSLSCNAPSSLRMLNAAEPGVMFAHIDLGPKILVQTHHDATSGPYHRGWREIGVMMRTWQAEPEEARAAIEQRADYLLICDDARYSRRTAQQRRLANSLKREVPGWLEPVELPERAPFRLYRVRAPENSSPDRR